MPPIARSGSRNSNEFCEHQEPCRAAGDGARFTFNQADANHLGKALSKTRLQLWLAVIT